VTHFDEDCPTFPNMANSAILWPAMCATFGDLGHSETRLVEYGLRTPLMIPYA